MESEGDAFAAVADICTARSVGRSVGTFTEWRASAKAETRPALHYARAHTHTPRAVLTRPHSATEGGREREAGERQKTEQERLKRRRGRAGARSVGRSALECCLCSNFVMEEEKRTDDEDDGNFAAHKIYLSFRDDSTRRAEERECSSEKERQPVIPRRPR